MKKWSTIGVMVLVLLAVSPALVQAEPPLDVSETITVNITVAKYSQITFDNGGLTLDLMGPGPHEESLDFSVLANFPYSVESEATGDLPGLPGWEDSVALGEEESGAAGVTSTWVLTVKAQPDDVGTYLVSGEYSGDITITVVDDEER